MDNEVYFTLALKYLQIRPRSEYEVKDYLTKKNAPEEVISDVIAFLKEKKFLSDIEFATWWIHQRTAFRQKGKQFIKIELSRHGVSKDVIDQAFEDGGEDHVSELEKAKLLLRKQKQKLEKLDSKKRYEKAGAFLARRGFDMGTIRKSIDETFGK